jgi:hypothetical protein
MADSMSGQGRIQDINKISLVLEVRKCPKKYGSLSKERERALNGQSRNNLGNNR